MTHATKKPSVTINHPVPHLETLELDSGDVVMYDPENSETYLQVDPCHMIELDGRWR